MTRKHSNAISSRQSSGNELQPLTANTEWMQLRKKLALLNVMRQGISLAASLASFSIFFSSASFCALNSCIFHVCFRSHGSGAAEPASPITTALDAYEKYFAQLPADCKVAHCKIADTRWVVTSDIWKPVVLRKAAQEMDYGRILTSLDSTCNTLL